MPSFHVQKTPVVSTFGAQPSSTPALFRQEPSNPLIELSRSASSQAMQSAVAIGKNIDGLRNYIETFKNNLTEPTISDQVFIDTLKLKVGMPTYNLICEEVASAIHGERNGSVGEKILLLNFRSILLLRDSEGRTPLDQVYDHLCNQREIYRAIGELYNLRATLLSLKECNERSHRVGPHYQDFLTSSELKARAIGEFKSLPPKAIGMLCNRIWELDSRPPHNPHYGYETVLGDVEKLLAHAGTSPIQDCIPLLETESRLPCQLTTSRTLKVEMRASDKASTIQDIQNLYALQDLKAFLEDGSKNNDFLVAKYRRMPGDLKDLLNNLIWLANYQPQELGFGERFITDNMRILLKIQNQDHVDIVSQLISHYEGKIQAQRLNDEIDAFIRSAGEVSERPGLILEKFKALSPKAQDDLRYRVWYNHGGHSNPHFGGWNYGGKTIESDARCLFRGAPHSIIWNYSLELQKKVKEGDAVLKDDFKRSKTLPPAPIDVSTKSLEREEGLVGNLPKNLRVAFVTAEMGGVASIGGLGSALDGMVRGFSAEDSRVIMPLYRNGPIRDELISQMRETDHKIEVEGRKIKIMKAKVNGVRCYFVDDPELFWIPKKHDGTSGNFYEGGYHHNKRRWAVFQKAAAELSYQMSKKEKPVELVHVHDAQTALVPKIIQKSHPEEWAQGRTPATVFTYHNTAEPNTYYDDTTQYLADIGLPKRSMNSFIEALDDADAVTTVSETFGKETQTTNPDFANGMHSFVHTAAGKGKLFGIVNGNSNGWNPARDAQLQSWKSVLPETKDGIIDLRYGPELSDQQLGEKTKLIQRELCAYLKQLDPSNPAYADLDPEKPIVMYLGRYDTKQKGINKLPMIMEETLRNGGQFVCIGTEPDSDAKRILEEMRRVGKAKFGGKGFLVLEDNKVGGRFVYQGVFGSMLRAACTLPIFPSRYEPCGLVQGEFNRFGKTVIATRTGGFPDTLKTEGHHANGYLFDRKDKWNADEQDLLKATAEQDDAIRKTLGVALEDAKRKQIDLYHGNLEDYAPHMQQTRTIMRDAHNSTWEKTPDGSLSAIRKLELVYAKAFQQRRHRGRINADLKTVKV